MPDLDLLDIPDDDYEAFIMIEKTFRQDFESEIQDNNSSYAYLALEYLNKTLAAAEVLNVEEIINALPVPVEELSQLGPETTNETFNAIRRASDKLKISIAIKSQRRIRMFSVGLESEQKLKIHAHLGKIREEVEASNASQDKKEKIFSMIAALAAEVDQLRTRFDRFADLARALAGLSKDVAEQGAEPWWKWMKGIFGIIDASKSEEPQLPKPIDIKRITMQND